MAGLDRWLTDFLKPIGNEPTKPSKQVMKVLKVPTIGISGEKSEQRNTSAGVSKVYIPLLGETIYLAESEAEAKGIDRGLLYTRKELQLLEDANPKPDELRLLHKAKQKFEGTIAEDTSAI